MTGSTGLRVATYNLWNGRDVRTGRVDLGAAAEAIAGLDADVVAVQEVDRGLVRSGGRDQVADLAARLGHTGVFAPALLGDPTVRWRHGPGAGPDPGGPAYGVGLLSALPLTAVAVAVLPGGGPGAAPPRRADARHPPILYRDGEPRAALRVSVATPWGPVAVTTTHLSFLPWRGLRQLSAVAAFAAAAEGDPDAPDAPQAPQAPPAAVLMGDLNLPWRVVEPALRRRGWSTRPAGSTFPSWRPVAQLDHLLVRGGVTLGDVRVGPLGPSDHLALSATVSPAA